MPKSNIKNKKKNDELTKTTDKSVKIPKTPAKAINKKQKTPKAPIKTVKTVPRVNGNATQSKAKKRLVFEKTAKKSKKQSKESDEEVETTKIGGKKYKSGQSWRKLTVENDLAAVSSVFEDNLRNIERYLDGGEDDDELTTASDTEAGIRIGSRNIASPHGAANILMKRAFIRTKSSECSKVLNNILKTLITNCAASTAAVMLACSPGKRRSDSSSSEEWTPKRCQTEHLRTVINHETGGTVLDIIDDVYKTARTVKTSSTQKNQEQNHQSSDDVVMTQ